MVDPLDELFIDEKPKKRTYKPVPVAKRCSHCQNLIRYPRRGLSWVGEWHYAPFKRKLCPECVEKGWYFDSSGQVARKSRR